MALLILLALLPFFLFLPSFALAKIVTTPYPRLARPDDDPAACVSDYEACGTAVLAPVHHLPCCSSAFYCYTRGPYFSQCRPERELQQEQTRPQAQPHRLEKVRKPLCGLDYGVCQAGNAASSAIPCCSMGFACKPAPPLYWKCVPDGKKPRDVKTDDSWGWFRIVPAWMRGRERIVRGEGVLYSFQRGEWGGVRRQGVSVEPVEAVDKVHGVVFRNGSVTAAGAGIAHGSVVAVLPVLGGREMEELVERVEDAMKGLGVDVVADRGRLQVTPRMSAIDFDVAEVAVTLAAFPHVLRVEVVDSRHDGGT